MTQNFSPQFLRELLSRNDTQQLRELFAEMHPHSIAEHLNELEDPTLWAVLRRFETPLDAQVFKHLPMERQIALANTHNEREVALLLEHMQADDRVDVIHGLDAERRERLISLLPAEEQTETERLAAYDEDSVGAVMNLDYAFLRPEMRADAAIQALRDQAPKKETVQYAMVIDRSGVLAGRVSLQDLVLAAPDATVETLMDHEPVTVKSVDPRTEAVRLIEAYDEPLLPVVENGGRLVGIVTFDDVMDVIEEEISDTMYQKAGIGDFHHQRDHVFSEALTRGGLWYPIRARMTFLLVALGGGMAVGGLIDYWEGTLEAILAAAIFIPVIMDMGGNTGTQSTTIFARGYALGHIDLKRFFPYLAREASIGLIMGVLLGTLGGAFAYLWQGAPNNVPELGLAVGLSLAAVIFVAAMLGFLLPYFMLKLGLDHAPGADPFITTIKDFTGLALYFYLVQTLVPVDLPA